MLEWTSAEQFKLHVNNLSLDSASLYVYLYARTWMGGGAELSLATVTPSLTLIGRMLAMCLTRCLSPQPHPKLRHLCCERSAAFYRNHFASLRQLLPVLPIVPRGSMAVIKACVCARSPSQEGKCTAPNECWLRTLTRSLRCGRSERIASFHEFFDCMWRISHVLLASKRPTCSL